MATVYQSGGITQQANPSGAPFGNLYDFKSNVTLNSSGILVPGTTADSGVPSITIPTTGLAPSVALANTDSINIAILPAGTKLLDAVFTISTAFVASTFNIGIAAVGTDTNSINNASYFVAGLAGNTAGVTRKTAATAPLKLPYDVYLVLTVASGLASGAAGVLDIDVIGVALGGTGL